MRTSMQQAGDSAEDLVAERLIRAGWTIVGRQVRVGRAELDLIAIDPGPPPALVVVEVRWRGRRDFGLPEETVDHRKQAHLRHAAWRWLDGQDRPALPVRFDLVSVEPGIRAGEPRIRHHRAAF
jgi:putative endonuclease